MKTILNRATAVSPLAGAVLLSLLTPHGQAVSQTCVAPPTGMVSWWRAENTATDSVGGNGGSLLNGASFTSGQVGHAFGFDGVDDVINIADAPDLNFSANSSFTIELWAFRTGTATVMHLVGKRSGCGGPPFYQMAIGPGAFPSSAVPLNVWTHLAVTYDGQTTIQNQYVDGVLVVSGSAGGSIGVNSSPLLIGSSGSCAPFAGRVDEVSLYDRALSSSEVQAIHLAGSGGKCASMRSVGGSVTAMSPSRVECRNLTTGQRLAVRNGARSWSCSAAGLVVDPGDRVQQIVTGPAD
ncbi:conserved exported hypothetical protein [uncultured Defluviicoccus sp.]|uniref:LamG-like jellyroll fold domain-containing protein n=1 Tax=metagenome TaxID=256318 RepID=A0A380TF84_9ZZZZ|nr:conserved exported hypothetical protein [uncultured Defluviicoccus sp.]